MHARKILTPVISDKRIFIVINVVSSFSSYAYQKKPLARVYFDSDSFECGYCVE